MAKILVEKRQNNSNDGFTETLKYYVMHQANVVTNHNKLYVIELQKHPDGRYRIYTNYGRLGISEIHEVRETIDGKPIHDLDTIEKEFEAIHKKKLSGKSVKDPTTGESSKECYVDIDTVSPAYGSVNIRGKAEVKKQVTVKIAVDTSTYDPLVAKLVDQLIEENVHSITSMTSIKLTANGFATELGPITISHVDKARKVLDDLNALVDKDGNLKEDNKDVLKLNSLFYSLIPKPFSRKISTADMILGAQKLQEEYDILMQLETSVTMGNNISQGTAAKMNALGTDIEVLMDKKEIKRITDYIVNSKADNHRGSDVWNFKVKQIFKIRIPDERARHEAILKKYGNVEEVFHSSSPSNCLSILKSGLIIPPSNAPHVCGRMMGNGVYGSSMSSKALNYGIGFWGGRKNKHNNAFLFIVNFAMGKTYTTYTAQPSGAPKGYDSLWAKPGKSLYNDELVVYKLEQCSIRYIVEMYK